VDAAIFHTIARIRNRDPTIYDASTQVFDVAESSIPAKNTQTRQSKQEKALRLKDIDRMALLGQLPTQHNLKPTPMEEEAALRAETRAAFHVENALDDSSDDLLTERKKDDKVDSSKEYRRFLVESVGKNALKLILQQDSEEDAMTKKDEDFLTNYILNRGWLEVDEADRIPTHQEIISHSSDEEARGEGPSGSNAMSVAHVQKKPIAFVESAYKPLEEVDDDDDADFEDKVA